MAKADPLPYIIVFAILYFISLGVLTWVLFEFNKSWQCPLNPNIWCADDFTCTNSCSVTPAGQPVNSCFEDVGTSGLASCLFGPTAPGATVCLTYSDPDNPAGDPACPCPQLMMSSTTQNCFNGCSLYLEDVPAEVACCCIPSASGCDPSRPPCPQIPQT